MGETYKLLQLQVFFMDKFDYISFASTEVNPNELWLFRYDEKYKYNLIRISLSNAENYDSDIAKYPKYIPGAKKLLGGKDPVILNIFINKDSYNSNLLDGQYINLDSNYYDGFDVSELFPGLKEIVHDAQDPKNEEDNNFDQLVAITKRHFKDARKKDDLKCIDIYVLIAICFIVFIIQNIIARNYSESTSYIIVGALYKTFTVGLKQFYRLITYAFVHGGIVHLLCNMFSFYMVGRPINLKYGTKKTLFILFNSILIGGFTQTLLVGNTICVGMSAGIYGLFLVYILTCFKEKLVNRYQLIPIIVLNIALNFLSTTAWIAHIGGLIGGLISYFVITKQGKERTGFIILYTVLLIALFIKLFMTNTVDTIYGGTDFEVVSFFENIGLQSYAKSLMSRLITFYSQLGG